jgi:hypothetical protein
MHEPWWERPLCFVCDKWWLILIALCLLLGGYFTRDYWLPAQEPDLGTGDIQVTLRWSGLNDLDLHVLEPGGEEISYQHTASLAGGRLDVDSNAGCNGHISSEPVENIFWPSGEAPSGHYIVSVTYYANCNQALETPFQVRVLVDGEVLEFEGRVETVNENVIVYEFTR